jgi:hypothetical protein
MINWQNIAVSKDQTHFVVNGKPVFGQRYIEVLKFHAPGLAPVLDPFGWHHIDVFGNRLYSENYARAFGFYCNRAAVVAAGASFHINEKGERAYSQSYSWVGNYQENLCPVRDKDGTYFHIDLVGNRVYEANYIYCGDFKDGIACVKCKDGFYKHIDTQGNNLNSSKYLDLGVFHKNFATAKDSDGWHHIDKSGLAIYAERYLAVEPFYNGFALVTRFDNQKLVIDEEGKTILQV